MKIDRSKIKNIQHRIALTPKSTYEFFYGNDSSEYCYAPILKNAHTWGKHFFKIYADFHPIQNHAGKKYIVFLRDPVQRWFSATSQWFELNHTGSEDYVIDQTMMKMIFSTVKLDAHAMLQLEFIREIPRSSDITFFDLGDPSFESNLKHFLYTYKICRFSKIANEKINVTEQDNFKSSIIEQLKQAFDKNVKYQDLIYRYYEADYDLIKKSVFYKPK
jgi:hypothetical protein